MRNMEKEEENREIQEGLIKACDVIDLIIEILRGAKTVAQAKACLVDGKTEEINFKSPVSEKMATMLRFTEKQADAVLAMRLSKLYEQRAEDVYKMVMTVLLDDEDELED